MNYLTNRSKHWTNRVALHVHESKGHYPQISFPLGVFGSVTECRHRESTSVFNYTSMPFAMLLLEALVSCQTGELTLSSLAWITD